MKFFVNSTVDILLLLLSFIIPKKNNTYLFGAGDGSSFKGNPKYLYLHMLQNRKDLSPLWITGNISVYKELRSRNLPVVLKNTLKGFGAILRSRYLVIEIMTKDIIYAGFTALGRFTFIQTFHGMPLKKIANDANQGMKGIGRLKIRCNEKIVGLISATFKRSGAISIIAHKK
ncbi:MAG TPA: CDP-glycerol glycerophosphotransferase family protein [Spirochaetota bacterium]|nr:CDP-glycerol glycerophosphotransferase family protein [Spirochaetota bacterium]